MWEMEDCPELVVSASQWQRRGAAARIAADAVVQSEMVKIWSKM